MKYYSVASRSRDPNNPNRRGRCCDGDNYMVQTFEINKSGISNTITSVSKDYLVLEIR